VAGWLVTAALAAGVTLAAVSVLGSGIFGGSTQTMSQEEVDRALAAVTVSPEAGSASSPAPTDPSAPSPTTGPPEPAGSDPTVVSSAGGGVIARCTGTAAEVLSWTPAQGFRTEKVERGPAPEVQVEFESDDRDVKVGLRCEDGTPIAEIDDDGDGDED
jgi:hypothetical protein